MKISHFLINPGSFDVIGGIVDFRIEILAANEVLAEPDIPFKEDKIFEGVDVILSSSSLSLLPVEKNAPPARPLDPSLTSSLSQSATTMD